MSSQRQLPTDHGYAVPTREYQLDQSSPLPATATARPVLERRQRQKAPQHSRCRQGHTISTSGLAIIRQRCGARSWEIRAYPHKGWWCSILSSRILMKPLLFVLCIALGCCGLSAQQPVWQPSPGHTQIPIWPGAAPDPSLYGGPETRWRRRDNDFFFPWRPTGQLDVEQRDPANDHSLFAAGETKIPASALSCFPAAAIRRSPLILKAPKFVTG